MRRIIFVTYLLVSVILFLTLLSPSSCEKKDLHIPVLAPMFGLDADRYAYATAVRYAFDLINNRSDILRDFHLIADTYDTVASITKSMYLIHQIIDTDHCTGRKLPPAIIGPAFSDATIATARAIVLYYLLQYTYGATSPVLDNHYEYPFLVRTLPGTSTYSKGHAALMNSFNWKRVGIFYDHHDRNGIFNRITEDLIIKLRSNNVTVVSVESVDSGARHIATSDQEIRERLEKLKVADIKIIFAQFSWVGAYRIFCQAYKLGMYGKNYVWIVHARVETVDKWLQAPENYYDIDTDCDEEQYKAVSEGMLYFQQQEFRKDGIRSVSGLTAEEYIEYITNHRGKKRDKLLLTTAAHAYAFDTAWSMALTLNKSIPGLKAINSTLDKMLMQNIQQATMLRSNAYGIEFEGITGRVRLSHAQGRIGTLVLYQMRNKTSTEVGTYHSMTGKLTLYPQTLKDFWPDGRVPSDRSLERTELLNIPLPLYLPICIVAGLGGILAILVLLFNIYHRNARYIRKSAPLFNNFIIFGIMMCLTTVAFFGCPVDLGETDKFLTMCKLRMWFLSLGFSLSFGSMFVKTWRVYKIFTNRKLKYSIERLSNTSLMGMVFAIVAIDALILLLWNFVDPMQIKAISLPKQVDPDDPNAVLLPVIYSCYSNNQDRWITSLYVLKGILLLYGLFLAYETRNVQFEHLNDSRMIGVCVYNVAVMSILGGLLRIILSDTYYKEIYGITCICIIFPSLGTLFLIFLPKVVRFVKRDTHVSETETTADGVVIEGPGARNGNHHYLRKDSVCSDGVTSTSSLPCSNSRSIMPIYEEATATTPDGSNASESPA